MLSEHLLKLAHTQTEGRVNTIMSGMETSTNQLQQILNSVPCIEEDLDKFRKFFKGSMGSKIVNMNADIDKARRSATDDDLKGSKLKAVDDLAKNCQQKALRIMTYYTLLTLVNNKSFGDDGKLPEAYRNQARGIIETLKQQEEGSLPNNLKAFALEKIDLAQVSVASAKASASSRTAKTKKK